MSAAAAVPLFRVSRDSDLTMVCFCVERSEPGVLSVASVVVMELCTVIRRYLDIEATIAGLSMLCFFYSNIYFVISVGLIYLVICFRWFGHVE